MTNEHNEQAILLLHTLRTGYICDPNECKFTKGDENCILCECDNYHDALALAIEALERHTPKKVEWCTDRTWGVEREVPVCPTCDYYLTPIEFIDMNICERKGNCEWLKVSYCEHCSQAIDWSEVE